MDDSTKKKLDEYFELFDAVSEKTKNERITVLILQELCKDKRVRQNKKNSNGDLATEKQKRLMQGLSIKFPEGITKKEASGLIEQELKSN